MEVNQQLSLAKKYVNRSNILAFGLYLLVILGAFVFSIPDLDFDPSQVFTTKFLTKQLVNTSLGVVSMWCTMTIFKRYDSVQQVSKIYKAQVEFRRTASDIINDENKVNRFSQWIEDKFNEMQQTSKDKRILRGVGIKSLRYLNLDYNELKELQEHTMKIGGEYYSQLNKEQYKTILMIKNGKTQIHFPKWTDYLSEHTYKEELELSEIIARESRDMQSLMVREYLAKILMGVIVGAVFISVVVQRAQPIDTEGLSDAEIEAIKSQKNWEVIVNLVSRLFNVAWSSFMGGLAGKKMNDESAKYLDRKMMVHKIFQADKEFKEKSEQELAREDWLKEQKEINKKANEEYANKLGLREHKAENEIIALGE